MEGGSRVEQLMLFLLKVSFARKVLELSYTYMLSFDECSENGPAYIDHGEQLQSFLTIFPRIFGTEPAPAIDAILRHLHPAGVKLLGEQSTRTVSQ